MGPDLELKGRSDTMDVSASKENKSAVRDSVDNHITCRTDYEGNITRMEDSLYEQAEQETIGHLVFNTGKSRSSVREPLDKLISCASNHEDSMFELHDQPEEVNTMKHHEVNIVECTHSFDDSLIETESENATESSSSYDDTACGDENDAVLSDPEVMSQLHSDEFGDLARIRKKRLTPHWKTYIQSHVWRCKWVELQIREFLSQASKYDMQLAHNSKRKQLRPNSFTIEDLGVELLPLPSDTQRDTVMKRKKRKRVEDTIDKAAYIAQHNLFSYFGDRRSSAVVRSFGDDRANIGILMDKKVSTNSGFGLTDEPTSLEFSDDDNSIEQILLKIWILESRVREMQTRVKEVMSVNAEQISSPRKLSVPVLCNTFIGSAQNLVSPPNNGDRILVQSSFNACQLLPQYNMGDLVIPASAVSSHEKGAHLPDDIERTVQFQFGTSYKNSDGHLMNKRKAKEKPNISEEVEILNIEKFKVPREEQEGTIPSSPVLEGLLTDNQPNPKALPVSKVASNTTRKRGRR